MIKNKKLHARAALKGANYFIKETQIEDRQKWVVAASLWEEDEEVVKSN